MKPILDYQKQEVANIFDEVNLWAAPFGRLLLENIPMKSGATIVDVGFGTGFPLVELSQRFGERSKVYGIDIWTAGIERTKEKINVLDITNIEILEESAVKINLGDQTVDLITSNLGVNNFEERDKVYAELYRILKPDGSFAITTNPIGTFRELFDLFETILNEMNLEEGISNLAKYLAARNTADQIIQEIEEAKFKVVKQKSDLTNMRFTSSEALLNHNLMRVGFREGWNNLIEAKDQENFYNNLRTKIDQIISEKGEIKMTIPLLYLEFQK